MGDSSNSRAYNDWTHFRLAMLTITLGLASSSRKRWTCSCSRRSLSSFIVALLLRVDMIDRGIGKVMMRLKGPGGAKVSHEATTDNLQYCIGYRTEKMDAALSRWQMMNERFKNIARLRVVSFTEGRRRSINQFFGGGGQGGVALRPPLTVPTRTSWEKWTTNTDIQYLRLLSPIHDERIAFLPSSLMLVWSLLTKTSIRSTFGQILQKRTDLLLVDPD